MSLIGIAGLVVLALAVLLLLVSLLHPEGRRRPGGYLDDRGSDDSDHSVRRESRR